MYVSSCNVKQTISILNYPSSKFTVGNSDFVGNFHRRFGMSVYHCHTKIRACIPQRTRQTQTSGPVGSLCGFFQQGSNWRIWSFWWSISGGKTHAVVAICGFQGLSWIMTSMFLNRETWEASCETPGHTWGFLQIGKDFPALIHEKRKIIQKKW